MEPVPEPPRRPRRKRRTLWVLFAVVVLAAGAVGVAAFGRDADDAPVADEDGRFNGTEVGVPQPRPDFVLTGTDGQPYDFGATTAGRLTLLFFGYTSCPDVCPLTLATLADALEEPGVPEPLVVFVGVDRARDTPEAIRTFLDRFDGRFVGLTGTEQELEAAQVAAGVPPAITEEPSEPGGDYLVGHSSQVLAFTADDQAHVIYPFGVRRQDWVEDLPLLAGIGRSGA